MYLNFKGRIIINNNLWIFTVTCRETFISILMFKFLYKCINIYIYTFIHLCIYIFVQMYKNILHKIQETAVINYCTLQNFLALLQLSQHFKTPVW